jgi:glycosyltransferase involved in cell wall biosynthesis
MIKTVHIVSTFPTSGDGISYYTNYFIEELRKRNHVVRSTRINFLREKLSTRKWLKLLGINEDILHLQYTPTGAGPLVYLFSAFRRKNVKFIITSHELPSTYSKHLSGPPKYLFAVLERTLHNSADAITVHTEQHRKELVSLGVAPSKVIVIPFPIYPAPPKDLTVRPNYKQGIFFGRITPKKGIEVLFDALQFLPSDISFSIIGPPAWGFESYTEGLKEQVRNRKLEERVTFRGYLDDTSVSRAMEEGGFAIFPYQYITQSAALMTAIGHGLPYVASDLPAFKEVYERHKGGLLFETGNARSLAHAIEQIVHIRTREDMIRELSVARETCNWQTYTDAMEKLYEN